MYFAKNINKEKTMKTRVISLLLALVFCLGMLASCGGGVVNSGDGGGGDEGGGDRTEDGGWDTVNFNGQKVNFCISVNKYDECTFPAADIYTRGPDQAGSNEVAKEVIARNAAAEKDLGIEINYSEKDLLYSEILEDVRKIVQTAANNSPDVYNNDLYGLGRAMVDGLLWNVKNPGDNVKNYFDFNAKGWYTEFMKGCTFDQNKQYVFAGDYFIDMIRMAWVVYVNADLYEQNINKMPYWGSSLDSFYGYVADGFWDLDAIADISRRVFTDDAGGQTGVTEINDRIVGLATNSVMNRIISAGSQITVYYQDVKDGYKPKVMQSIDTYQKVSNKYVEMLDSQGVYYDTLVVDSTNRFLQGNFLFAYSRLGEMESEGLRNFSANKSLVPMPKWDIDEQEEYHTVVHDQVEVGCILNTAKAYSAASALMQYLNENSGKVVEAYYEKGLKYKYNDDANAREMMDLVRATTDSPFSWQIGVLCNDLYTGTGTLADLSLANNTTVGSSFAANKDAYDNCLKLMLEKFAKLQ